MEQGREGQGALVPGLLNDRTSYLKAEDFEEEDGEDSQPLYPDLTCACCEEPLTLNEEIIVIVVVQAQSVVVRDERTGQPRVEVQFYPVLDESEDFEYHPLRIHFDCWEETCGEFHEIIADELPARPEPEAVCTCTFCKASIGPFREFARVALGEITLSQRRGITSFEEAEGGSPEPVCLECMGRINDQCVEVWKDKER